MSLADDPSDGGTNNMQRVICLFSFLIFDIYFIYILYTSLLGILFVWDE